MRFSRNEFVLLLLTVMGAGGCPGRGSMTTPDEPDQPRPAQPAPSASDHRGTGLPPGIVEPEGAPTDDVQRPPERRPAELPQ
jgi:hypothetical protein